MESKTVSGIKQDFGAAKKKVSSEFSKARTKLVEAQHRTEKYIAKNPKRAAAIAAGIGAVVGSALTAYFMKHKSRKNEKSEKTGN